ESEVIPTSLNPSHLPFLNEGLIRACHLRSSTLDVHESAVELIVYSASEMRVIPNWRIEPSAILSRTLGRSWMSSRERSTLASRCAERNSATPPIKLIDS